MQLALCWWEADAKRGLGAQEEKDHPREAGIFKFMRKMTKNSSVLSPCLPRPMAPAECLGMQVSSVPIRVLLQRVLFMLQLE